MFKTFRVGATILSVTALNLHTIVEASETDNSTELVEPYASSYIDVTSTKIYGSLNYPTVIETSKIVNGR